MNNSKVVVGIPTYKRNNTLKRTLNSLFLQDYPNIEIIISDNQSGNFEIINYIEKLKNDGININYISNVENIGGVKNLFKVLEVSEGEFFMWLADDDEIEGVSYISDLVALLKSDPGIVTAFAPWKLLTVDNCVLLKPFRDYPHESYVLRAFKYVWFANDDFFYGLHRTDVLKRARKISYIWPNKSYINNWTFVFLFDLILCGKVVQSRNQIAWVNHDYSFKHYNESNYNKLFYIFRIIILRVNVHFLLLYKLFKRGGLFVSFFVLPVSLVSFLKELLFVIVNLLKQIFQKI